MFFPYFEINSTPFTNANVPTSGLDIVTLHFFVTFTSRKSTKRAYFQKSVLRSFKM